MELDEKVKVTMTGRRLKQERLKRGWTIEDVASQLRIHADFLRALEEDDWDRLPSGFYRKAFLRAYQQFLGIEGPPEEKTETRSFFLPAQEARLHIPRSLQLFGVIVSIVGLLIVAGWYVHLKLQKATPVSPSVSPAPVEHIKNTSEGLIIMVAEPGHWIIQARRTSEIEILADDHLLFKGEIRAGERFEVTAHRKLEIRADGIAENLNIARIRSDVPAKDGSKP